MQSIAPTFDGKRAIPSQEVTQIMLEMLKLTSADKVLEVGTGSGYQTRKLAETGAEIHSIELEPFADMACLYGWPQIYLHTGDGKLGLAQEAPFTAIVATCGLESIPEEWNKQLAEHGRIVAPIGTVECQKLTLFTKHHGWLVAERVGAYVRFQMVRDQA